MLQFSKCLIASCMLDTLVSVGFSRSMLGSRADVIQADQGRKMGTLSEGWGSNRVETLSPDKKARLREFLSGRKSTLVKSSMPSNAFLPSMPITVHSALSPSMPSYADSTLPPFMLSNVVSTLPPFMLSNVVFTLPAFTPSNVVSTLSPSMPTVLDSSLPAYMTSRLIFTLLASVSWCYSSSECVHKQKR